MNGCGVMAGLDFEPGCAVGGTLGELDDGGMEEAAGGAKQGALAAAGGAEDDGPWGGEVQSSEEMQRAEVRVDTEAVMRLEGVGGGVRQARTSSARVRRQRGGLETTARRERRR